MKLAAVVSLVAFATQAVFAALTVNLAECQTESNKLKYPTTHNGGPGQVTSLNLPLGGEVTVVSNSGSLDKTQIKYTFTADTTSTPYDGSKGDGNGNSVYVDQFVTISTIASINDDCLIKAGHVDATFDSSNGCQFAVDFKNCEAGTYTMSTGLLESEAVASQDFTIHVDGTSTQNVQSFNNPDAPATPLSLNRGPISTQISSVTTASGVIVAAVSASYGSSIPDGLPIDNLAASAVSSSTSLSLGGSGGVRGVTPSGALNNNWYEYVVVVKYSPYLFNAASSITAKTGVTAIGTFVSSDSGGFTILVPKSEFESKPNTWISVSQSGAILTVAVNSYVSNLNDGATLAGVKFLLTGASSSAKRDSHTLIVTTASSIGCTAGFSVTSGICSQCAAGYFAEQGASQCTTCRDGYFSSNPGASECTKCGAGTHGVSDHQSCPNCDDGYYSSEGASVCTKCGAGTHGVSDHQSCPNCADGYYSSEGASSWTDHQSCPNCADGYYSSEGASVCTKCGAGTHGVSDHQSCPNCADGYYSSEGASVCTKCGAGTHGVSDHQSCPECDDGYYSSEGASVCTKCGAGTHSESPFQSCAACTSPPLADNVYCPGSQAPTQVRDGYVPSNDLSFEVLSETALPVFSEKYSGRVLTVEILSLINTVPGNIYYLTAGTLNIDLSSTTVVNHNYQLITGYQPKTSFPVTCGGDPLQVSLELFSCEASVDRSNIGPKARSCTAPVSVTIHYESTISLLSNGGCTWNPTLDVSYVLTVSPVSNNKPTLGNPLVVAVLAGKLSLNIDNVYLAVGDGVHPTWVELSATCFSRVTPDPATNVPLNEITFIPAQGSLSTAVCAAGHLSVPYFSTSTEFTIKVKYSTSTGAIGRRGTGTAIVGTTQASFRLAEAPATAAPPVTTSTNIQNQVAGAIGNVAGVVVAAAIGGLLL
ncbi:UNVERIFIED_CONTAM: hypothetical protein HDU68_006954 [Siphonaria sp. JEL0065]|nr:hypothetical protein HDU68_006954 [Siphonaria sp. JEL0065]